LTEEVPEHVRRRLAALGARDFVAEHAMSEAEFRDYIAARERVGFDVYTDGETPEEQVIAARATLIARRAALHRQRAALREDWLSIVETTALSATDDEHDPEGATIAYERSRVAALLAQIDTEREALELALQRVEAGTYGWCLNCGAAIPPERLAARPAAERCITCAGTLTP
jgi:RNA polymerase-binding transcription factor DksA